MSATVTEVNGCGVCAGCGAGLGRPHFERCHMPATPYQRGVSQPELRGLTDYALGIFPIDVVRRSTIRAMLPRGRTTGHPTPEQRKAGKVSKNTTSAMFTDELRRLHRRGWIKRGEDHVLIVARVPLLRCAQGQLRNSADLVTALHESVAGVAAGLPPEITVAGRAQRAAELRALQRLMQEAPGTGPHAGRGHVELASKPRML